MLDYTDAEIELIRATLKQRYREDIEIFLADCEIQPDNQVSQLVERPAVFWQAMDCNFIVVKVGENNFQGRFFYYPDEHFGDSQQYYSDAANCVTALLRSQSDQVRESEGVASGSTGADLI